MISFRLDEDLAMLRATAREFAQRQIRPVLRDAEHAHAVPSMLSAAYHALGLAALELPPEAGGAGLGALAHVVVAEELATGDAGIACALPGPGAAGIAVRVAGTAPQLLQWLAPFADDAAARGALAVSSRAVPRVRAREFNDGWVLDGRSAFVQNAAAARLLVVLAELESGGLGLFALAARHAGVTCTRLETVMLEAAPLDEVAFDAVALPRDALLGGAPIAPVALAEILTRVALVASARAVGLARASYEHALQYAHEREAFGKPIGHFQAVAFMLTDMYMDVEAARAAVWRAAVAIDQAAAAPPPAMFPFKPVCQAISTAHEAALRVSGDAVQILGGAGYVQDHPVEKWMRDARALTLCGLPRESADAILAELTLAPDAPLAQSLLDHLPLTQLQPVYT